VPSLGEMGYRGSGFGVQGLGYRPFTSLRCDESETLLLRVYDYVAYLRVYGLKLKV
jgi:hypothetical protein